MRVWNDYKLLYLYHLSDNEGKLRNEYRSEYERLKLLYSIDRAKSESKDYLEELGYIEYKGTLKNGEWIESEEDKRNPTVITKTGLIALDKRVFESETAEKIIEKREKGRIFKKDIIGWSIALFGLILSIVLFVLDRCK